MDARAAAARTLERVFNRGQSLNEALEPELARVSAQDRGLAQALVYGVLRGFSRLEAISRQLLERPLRAKDTDIRMLLLSGLYEALELRTPDHAVVAANAGAARALRKTWAVGLINALLRRFLREREALLALADAEPAARHAHPRWILRRLQAAWPEHWEAIVHANNAHPPMTLRVNRRLASREEYLHRLHEAGIEAHAHPLAPSAIVLAAPVAVERLPGFAEGAASVQDAAAQLAAELLDVPPGARVLDACAAPGGKACHILERQPELAELLAVDIDPARTERVRANLARLALEAKVQVADVGATEGWWDGRPFERILLDAPCSGSGVIRRHPDIKWLRRDSDIGALADTQRRLLDALWPLLAREGKLVYVTCSVFPDENEAQVQDFLARHPDARVEPVGHSQWGLSLAAGLQLLPGEHELDGFYYACLSKC